MSAGSGNLLQQWISDFCAPVVVVVATEEAERICLQNGLLMHELLSCFGQIDAVNSMIRVGTQIINISDGHIRFERGTETKAKTPEIVEELLHNTFQPYSLSYLPANPAEIKADPPTAWTRDVEQIFSRAMSFHECEMISHPVLILNVVATSDQEPVVAMQELASVHHTPSVFSNGQYDSNIHRVFVLLEDATEKHKDPLSILRGLNSYFPPAHTKLLSINSFPATAPNLQQPDMWSKNLIPKFFRNHAPLPPNNLPMNPVTNTPVLGSRLSVEDFMKLREFCIWLFSDQILPVLERRLNYLTQKVNDSRKGVKNVFKSFWRKPRDETDTLKGGVKYRFDKIESQTLMLGDLSFSLKDYETAGSMYRLVRDDYKADKSNLHYIHSLMMCAICQIISEPQKYRDVHTTLELIAHVMQGGLESALAHAYFALLSSEVYVLHPNARSPLDSARILLQASSSVSRYPLMSSLLMERAASFYLQANQVRKYILYCVITGIKMHKIGKYAPTAHATTCFATAMLLLEKGYWGDMKGKLTKAVSEDFKLMGREGAQRSLLFLLKILNSMLQETAEVGLNSSLVDAVSILNEILGDGVWGAIRINEGWTDCSARDIMLGSLPIGPLDISMGDITKSRAEVYGLPVPEVVMSSVTMLQPINGYVFHDQHSFDSDDKLQRILLIQLLNTEREWVDNESKGVANARTLEEVLIRTEKESIEQFEINSKLIDDHSEVLRVPQGERILVKMLLRNRLPVDITLSKVHLEVNQQTSAFEIPVISQTISGDAEQEMILELVPKALGHFFITNVRWNLSEQFTVLQPIKKKGILLHKTIAQRANYERTKDQQLKFEVISAAPLLTLKFEGLSSEILQGQLMRGYLTIKNDGTAAAHHIYLKLSQPCFVFYLTSLLAMVKTGESLPEGKFLEFYGPSHTIVNLDGIVIQPGEEIRVEAWLRLTRLGLQKISLLASYQQEDLLSEKRYSYISIKTTGLPSLGLSMQVATRPSSTHLASLITEITNAMVDEHEGKELIRLSSVGQLDLPDLEEHFIDVDSNCVKIVGLLLLGGAVPYHPPSLKISPNLKERIVIATPTDRLSHVWPIQLLPPPSSAEHHNLQQQLLQQSQQPHSTARGDEHHLSGIQDQAPWLINLPEIELDRSLKLSKNHLQSIVEQFLILWYAYNDFMKKMKEARHLLLLEELEANAAGPRSIQDVRREREKLTKQLQQSDQDELATLPVNQQLLSSLTASTASILNPPPGSFSVSDIVRKERCNHSMGITAIWVCRWQEKIRWGMHHLPFLSLLSSIPPKERILTTPSLYFNNPLAYLRIAVNHPKRWIWRSPVMSSSSSEANAASPIVRYRNLPVTVTIQSLSLHRSIRFSLQALPYELTSVKEVFQRSPEEMLVTKLVNVGFTWSGKTRYNQLLLQPKEERTLTFDCQFLRPGVYNLNRFGVIAEFTDDEEDHLTTETTWTTLPGASLFTILPKKDLETYLGRSLSAEESAMAVEEEEEEVEAEDLTCLETVKERTTSQEQTSSGEQKESVAGEALQNEQERPLEVTAPIASPSASSKTKSDIVSAAATDVETVEDLKKVIDQVISEQQTASSEQIDSSSSHTGKKEDNAEKQYPIESAEGEGEEAHNASEGEKEESQQEKESFAAPLVEEEPLEEERCGGMPEISQEWNQDIGLESSLQDEELMNDIAMDDMEVLIKSKPLEQSLEDFLNNSPLPTSPLPEAEAGDGEEEEEEDESIEKEPEEEEEEEDENAEEPLEEANEGELGVMENEENEEAGEKKEPPL